MRRLDPAKDQHVAQRRPRRRAHEVERRLLALGCPKLNLQVRSSNTQVLDFYRALGYLQDDVVSLGKRLIADTPAGDPPRTSTS